MVYRNTVEGSPPDSRLEKTTNCRSPDIEEMNEDTRQTHNIYHIQNCDTVCMSVDSFNASGVKMENCGNNTPQVTCSYSFLFFSFSLFANLAILYYLDHPGHPSNEKVIHSHSHAVSNGMWHSASSAIKHVEYVLSPLGPQNATSPPTAPTEIAKSNPSDVHLQTVQTNALSPPQSPQSISLSHISGDHIHHNMIKHLEQLLDSSLADVLTPRAYDTLKALYALAALDAAASSTKPRGSEILNRSTFPDIGNDSPYSSNRSPPLPNSRIHISISVDNFILFSWAGLAAVSFLVVVFFNFPRLCERDATGLF
jgi:hypothetical protein